jgi:molecular chaperone DnaK (HSP70)
VPIVTRSRWRPLLAASLVLAGCTKDSRPAALGEGISVEQPGGGATQLLAPGVQLPTSATESFTTSKDSEQRLFVHLLRGGGKKAEALDSLGWWSVDGVSAGPAGQPRAMVTVEVDAKGELSLSAREEDKKLRVAKVESPGKVAPARLSEPDDDDESVDEE